MMQPKMPYFTPKNSPEPKHIQFTVTKDKRKQKNHI